MKLQLWEKTATYTMLVIGSIVFLIPFLWLLATSFKTPNEVAESARLNIPGVFYKQAKPELSFKFTFPADSTKITPATKKVLLTMAENLRLQGRDIILVEVVSPDDSIYSDFLSRDLRNRRRDALKRVVVREGLINENRSLLSYDKNLAPNEFVVREAKNIFFNYIASLRLVPLVRFFGNTLLIILYALLGTVFSSAICAYAFARFKVPGSGVLFAILLATMMLPGVVTLIPIFILFEKIGWINTFKPLIVPAYFGGGAFNIFLLRQFFLTLPKDIEDAASIDGAGWLGILFRIVIPLSKPALITVAIFTFMYLMNEFMTPLIYLHDVEKFNIAVGLNLFRSQYVDRVPWGPLMAASTLMILPMILVFFFAQRYFIKGIALTGMK